MYADDTVLLADAPEGLQDMLNTLHKYTDEWNLSVNVQKKQNCIFLETENVLKIMKNGNTITKT